MLSQLGRLLVLVVLTLCLSMTATRAEAIVDVPWAGGSRAGEPEGIAVIRIVHEDLVIDLRPLADPGGLVAVVATYQLDNPAGEQQLDLVFATGSDIAGYRVTLDGHPVSFTSPPSVTLSESWHPPATTPMFEGGELQYRLPHEETPIGLWLVVPPGRHTLAISYPADAVRYHHGDPTVLRQFAYVLSPARTWAGFGGLDVTVHVPPDWRAAVRPAMSREGDTLHASFATVPADAIALTVQAPVGAYRPIAFVTRTLFALFALGGGFVVAWRARSCERRSKAGSVSRLVALGRGLAWGLAVLTAGILAIVAPDLALPEGQADQAGYRQVVAFVGVVLASAVATVIGVIVSLVGGRRVHATRYIAN